MKKIFRGKRMVILLAAILLLVILCLDSPEKRGAFAPHASVVK